MSQAPRRKLQAATVPRWLRPKLTRDQVRDMAIIQLHTLADLQTGQATEATLWDLVRNALTWSKVAELLDVGQHEMADNLELVRQLIDRYGATGCVGFASRAQDEAARLAAAYMEDLAAIVDRDTALIAAAWSEAYVDQLDALPGKRGALPGAARARAAGKQMEVAR
jgi:hypothetical protein